jgi:signal transduction histidine kinase
LSLRQGPHAALLYFLGSIVMNHYAAFEVPELAHLDLASTLQDLALWSLQLDLASSGQAAITLFEQHPLLPGIILTLQQEYVGMISRRQFFEYMSRPFSLELFSKRPLAALYEFARAEILILLPTLAIGEAVQKSLQRPSDLAYDPIVVMVDGNPRILGMQQLLIAHAHLHALATSALQRSEQQFRQQAHDLQKVLRELQRSQDHLVQSEKMSALGQLVAGVAHEINNPVTFIAGNIEHLSQYMQDLLQVLNLYQWHYPEPVAEIQALQESVDLDFLQIDLPQVLKSMQVGGERIQQIVLSLRNFSRHDESARKTVNIHEGIDSTLVILAHRLKPSGSHQGIQVVKEYGDLPPIDCYAGQLNQVFMNLVSNAIDVLEESAQRDRERINQGCLNQITAPTIWIKTKCLNQTHISIQVADNGIGIQEQVKRRLFDPFFTTKPVGKGTGLGLSISYQIVVEKHQGQLHCNSTPGQGTEFTIEIPIRQDHLLPKPVEQ